MTSTHYVPVHTEQFETDVERMRFSGRKSIVGKFKRVYLLVLDQSLEGKKLLKNFRDHELMGQYQGYRELHIQHDWLIIYKPDHIRRRLYFVRMGTHADLFS